MNKLILAFLALTLFVPKAFASSPIWAQIQEPKSPTNQTDLNINVVVLDQNDLPITVQCYYQKNGGGFNTLGGPITVNPNGGNNTANCQTNSSIINDQTTYNFYATANDGVNPIFTTSTVNVVYNTSGPDTPTSYSKSRVNTCDYKISFHTANDGGKTVKVEVYRSGQTSFTADSGSRVDIVNIGSNQDGSSTTTPPTCNQDYYFAIRAFDSNGNGSGLIGDSSTVTINPPTSTGTSGTSGASGTAGAIPAGTNGNVLGASNGPIEGSTGPSGGVLGEATLSGTPTEAPPTPTPTPAPIFSGRNIGIGGGLLIVILLLIFLFK